MEKHIWRPQLQAYISQVDDTQSIGPALTPLVHLVLPQHDEQCSKTAFCADFKEARQYFLSGPYEDLLYKLIEVFSSVEQATSCLDCITSLFTDGPADVAFEVLCSGLADTHSLVTSERCLCYLSQHVSSGSLTEIIVGKCSTDTQMFNGEYDTLVQVIVSLPDRASNRFQKNVPESLQRDPYYTVLFKALLSSLGEVKCRIERGAPSSLALISQLIGKLCLHGLAMQLWTALVANIMVSQDFLISRIFHKVILGIPLKALDSSMIPLVRCVNHYDDLSALLGNTIIESKRLQFLLMDKILLHRFYISADVHKLLYNVIGYLASSPTRLHLYLSIFSKLLAVWADTSSIKCISYDQHFYISKAIVVCSTFYTRSASQRDGVERMKLLMTGLQNHLSNSDAAMRYTGMAVAELVSETLNPDIEKKLQFSYDTSEVLDELKTLLSPPTSPGMHAYTPSGDGEVKGQTDSASIVNKKTTATKPLSQDLDSDDDLEPLGEFKDSGRSKEKVPAYVGDCMQGLFNEENPERMESCLKVASKLIRRNKAMTQEVSVEFAKILLHMGGAMAIDNYLLYRHEAMVSLLVISPVPVAEYLCGQFLSRNYNVRQRLDMLDALAVGAEELSDPQARHEQKASDLVTDLSTLDINKSAVPDWRRIVDARVRAKTRRFASASAAPRESTANRFAAVAGHFFFPLLMAVRECEGREYNPLKADTMLLVQYIYTLGKILSSAQHCPLVSRMAAELLDLVWVFRGSGEVAVRKAAVFCIAMSLMVIPRRDIFSHTSRMSDTGDYLSELMEHDPDPEVKQMAGKVLAFLQHQLEQGLDSKAGGT